MREAAEKQVEQLGKQTKFCEMTQTKVQELAREKLGMLQVEINRREDDITQLRSQILMKDNHLSKLQVTEYLTREDNKTVQGVLAKKDRELEALQQELQDTRRKLDEVVMTRKAEGTALLQIEHYKADNERLVQMLAQTKEFANFG